MISARILVILGPYPVLVPLDEARRDQGLHVLVDALVVTPQRPGERGHTGRRIASQMAQQGEPGRRQCRGHLLPGGEREPVPLGEVAAFGTVPRLGHVPGEVGHAPVGVDVDGSLAHGNDPRLAATSARKSASNCSIETKL